MGDFNATLFMEERSTNLGLSKEGCSDFYGWVQWEGLIDMGFVGKPFT